MPIGDDQTARVDAAFLEVSPEQHAVAIDADDRDERDVQAETREIFGDVTSDAAEAAVPMGGIRGAQPRLAQQGIDAIDSGSADAQYLGHERSTLAILRNRPAMSITILGAGAIGTYLGARLASAGEDVVLVGRGDHQRAIAASGVQVQDAEGHRRVNVPCYGPHDNIRPADVVILTAKAHDLHAMLPQIDAARKPNATVVAAQNGIPWWYFQQHGGELEGLVLESVDAGGMLARSLDPQRVIGCVVYCPVSVLGPGIVQHEGPRRLEIGQPGSELTPSLDDLAGRFERAGFAAPRSRNLRREIWIKLLANGPLNPLGALARKPSGEIAQHPAGKRLVAEMMRECLAVAKGTGLSLDISVEERLAQIPRQVGNHKSSMLQDVERGRRLELGPLVGAVVELGDRLGIDVSVLRYVYLMAQLI